MCSDDKVSIYLVLSFESQHKATDRQRSTAGHKRPSVKWIGKRVDSGIRRILHNNGWDF